MNYLVVGCGSQGSACALQLVKNANTNKVIAVDISAKEPAAFLVPYLNKNLEIIRLDINDHTKVKELLEGMDVMVSALPYYLNLDMTKLAVEAGVHYCDLGGNTAIVEQQKALFNQAAKADISIVPDCGLAPGLVNILAQMGIDELELVTSVNIYVGGLPTDPKPPLNYQIVYSMEGVLDYYTTPVLVLENGKLTEKEALSGLEKLEFNQLGTLEAFYTAGGISTMPMQFQGKIAEMSYKTLRYPGHATLMKSFRDLGLFTEEPILVGDQYVSPRESFISCVEPKLLQPEALDLVALRVVVQGQYEGKYKRIVYEMVEYADLSLNVSAMMRTTGYSLAAVAILQASTQIDSGVYTPSECIPCSEYLQLLHEYSITISTSYTH